VHAYAGDLVALVLTQLAAAYAIVKTIDATIHTSKGFAFLYRGGSDMANYMGLYELISVLVYLSWSLMISIVGYIQAGLLYQQYDDRIQGANKGDFGVAIGETDGYKYLALGCIIGAGAWISSLMLGDSASKLLGFYDNYNSKIEALGDRPGTSLQYDILYHTLTLFF